MKGSTYKRCACKDPATGKPLNQRCPDLSRRRHGTWTLDCRIDTTDRDGRRLKRSGYASQKAAETALDHIADLIKLARDDDGMRRRIGSLIFERSKRGGELPDVDEARRKLGAGADIAAPSVTVREWLEEWYAGKRKIKASTRASYRQHMDHYLIPLLGDLPRDRLRVEHIVGMFDTIDEWNAELAAAKEQGRKPHLPDDKRVQPKVVGNTTQHRILATLRIAYNAAVKRPGMIDWNPCLAVELPPEEHDPAMVWSPEQVAQFLRHARRDRLGVLYRLILLRGLRRGEALGLRWEDLDGQHATIRQTIILVGGRLVIDTPKSRASRRTVSLDMTTAELIDGEHRARQRRERFAAGEAYTDHGLIFCREDGTPLAPDWVSRRFKELAADAGLPAIKLHDGRHTAATLGLEAGLDIKVVSDQLGHSGTRITQDLYTHVRQAVHDDAAERVLRLIPEQDDDGQETGS